MADNGNEVKIKVILDTEEARAKLTRLQGELDRITNRSGGATAGSGMGVATSPANVVTQVERSVGSGSGQNNPERAGRDMASAFRKGLKGSGIAIGIEAAKRIVEVIRSEQQIWRNIEYHREQKVGLNNRDSRIEQAAFNTGEAKRSQWGSLGSWMMGIGGALAVAGGLGLTATGFGAPAGLALAGKGALMVGGAAAALGGAAWLGAGEIGRRRGEKEGEAKQSLVERDRVDTNRMSFYLKAYQHDISHSQSQGMMALERILQFSGSKEQRLSLLRGQEMELRYGDGPNSLRRLRENRERFIAEGNTESVDFQKNEMLINAQMSTLEDLRRKQFHENYMVQRIKPWEGADFADSFSKKGLYVGAQVDVGAANKPVVDELKRLNDMMRGFLSQASDELGKRDVRDRSVTAIMGARYKP